jgi:NitT/TauT family transport system ATP-binding protein
MALSATGLEVTYRTATGKSVHALTEIDLEIKDREFVTIIGPSGCGKSTLLKALGGLLLPTSGVVEAEGAPIVAPDPKQAAFVFQDYTLLPWKNVLDNAAIGLHFAKTPRDRTRAIGQEMLELVGLADFANAYPRELSGGMQQRVAIARAMCMDPRNLLLDEPFGALDEQTRQRLGFEMARILTEAERTVVMVTHSLDEAIFWADRIIVLSSRPGRIAREIHVPTMRPRPLSFIGTPEFASIRSELFRLLEVPAEGAPSISAVPSPAESA